MRNIGYIFPGQGSQYVGMGSDLYEKYPAAKEVFDRANVILGFDLKKVCFEGPKEELTRTDISQPAILTHSIAALRALEENMRVTQKPRSPEAQIRAAAGLSLGEYSALIAAGVLLFEDAVLLVHKRGKFMQEAADKNKGAMASLIGLSKEAAQAICNESGVQIANLNCPGQIVISGSSDGVNKAAEIVKASQGARFIMLEVSGPFHSKYMQEAGRRLEAELNKIKPSVPNFPVIANVTGRYEHNAKEIINNLAMQVSSPVLWEDSMRLMLKDGIRQFLEVGPGATLKGIAKRIDNNIKVYNIGTVEEIEEFFDEVKQG